MRRLTIIDEDTDHDLVTVTRVSPRSIHGRVSKRARRIRLDIRTRDMGDGIHLTEHQSIGTAGDRVRAAVRQVLDALP